MNVDLEPGAIDENKVARRATRPNGESPCVKELADLQKVADAHDDINVLVGPSLDSEERVDAPTTVEPDLNAGGLDELKQLDKG
jgi:hypothetical protein